MSPCHTPHPQPPGARRGTCSNMVMTTDLVPVAAGAADVRRDEHAASGVHFIELAAGLLCAVRFT